MNHFSYYEEFDLKMEERLERLNLDELMETEDAREWLAAFLEKRGPVWKDR